MAGGFTWGGTAADSLGLKLLRGPVPIMATLRERELTIDGRHGAYDFGTEFGRREFDLACSVRGTAQAHLWDRLGTIAQVFDPTQAYQQLIFDHQVDRYYLARLSSPPDFSPASPREGMLSLALKCKDAFAYATTQSSASHTITASPQAATASPSGNAPSELTLEMVCGSAISGGTVVVNDTTAGLSISWAGTLSVGDVLTVRASDWVCQRNGTTIMDNVSGEFPLLRGGTANSITYTGFRGTVALTWRDRWL